MQANRSTEELILEDLNSVPKYLVFLFLKNADNRHTRAEISDAVDRNKSNVSAYLNDLQESGYVDHVHEDGTKYWQLAPPIREAVESPAVEIRPAEPEIELQTDGDVDINYEVNGDEVRVTALAKSDSPETIEEAVSTRYDVIGGLLAMFLVGGMMALTGMLTFVPPIAPDLGGILFGGSLIGFLTLMIIAYKELGP